MATGTDAARTRHALGLFAGLADGYERREAILSLGQGPLWRRFLVERAAVPPHAHVLDVATGTAAIARELARRFGCRVTGVDQSAEMLARGRENVIRDGLADRVELLQAHAEALPFADATFDGLTAAYLLRYVDDPPAVVAELARVCRPGAPMAYLDFGVPPSPPARAAWELFTRALLPAAGRLAGPGWYDAGRFLGPSIRDFDARYPPPVLADVFAAAGVSGARYRRLSLGGGVVVWGIRA